MRNEKKKHIGKDKILKMEYFKKIEGSKPVAIEKDQTQEYL
jgi:hypothetical protein